MSDKHEELDDGQLVKRTLAGDRAAFERLYDRYARRVRSVVWSAAGEPSAVDDLTQECFLRAYQKLDQLRSHEHFGPWVIGVSRHVAREKRRSLRRDRHRFVGTAPSNDQGRAADARSTLSTDSLPDDLEMLLELVRRLPEPQRVAIELFFLEECDAEKTARMLGMSRSGVYALLKRACRNLAKSIERGSNPRVNR